ncbi:FtsX-like permease family protein [Posidoniimonas polymericola]|uniref:FtsX-like permease family protein n=1 Tax=Posidoniimonas polymericola TaxID=2528002 RepID=A0A5C5XWB1_9BACT|nr:ABC transporter permease DevC [Posidoniimonas polymericola]TWT66275.1 FtsX-like permease family protein [Posidoniimonas polymericola]
MYKTPLAWKNLMHDRRRLATAIAGIGFAVLLMFVQVGFQNALYDSQVRLVDALGGDLFITSRDRFAIAAETRFPVQRLLQARSLPGVTGAYPLYSELTTSVFKNFGSRASSKGHQIRSMAIELGTPVFQMDGLAESLPRLRGPFTAIVDRQSKPTKFAVPTDDDALLAEANVEVSDQRLNLVGTFELGTDFVNEGNLIMSTATFAKLFPHRVPGGDPLSVVDLGIVDLAEGANPEEARDALAAMLGEQVSVYTREGFREKEMKFWRSTTPIGAVFSAGKVIGFVVGVVICYQVIFSGISDHMPEFATLKAMGYQRSYFVGLIVVEAVWLAVFGFLPGAVLSTGLYHWLADQTGLLMQMTLSTLLFVFVITVIMCVASGLLAVRKLLTADPASLF